MGGKCSLFKRGLRRICLKTIKTEKGKVGISCHSGIKNAKKQMDKNECLLS